MLDLIKLLLGSLATIFSDPALGYRGAAVVRILGFASLALERGTEGYEQLKDLTEQVKAMADAGREPSKDEWDLLRRRSDEYSAILNPPEAPPSPPEG